MDDDNNIFDKDDALDYVMHEEVKKKSRSGQVEAGALELWFY